jgi:heterodisulfide reductase subunit A
VTGRDPYLDEEIRLPADLVVLSTGIVPHPVDEICRIFNIKQTQDGFIKETDGKWRPVDTGREGVFVAGLCRGPANAKESMLQGEAAAYRAFRLLSRHLAASQRQTPAIRHAICSRCELCITVCPDDARYIDMEQGKIMVDFISCQGCGACAAVCPNSATVMGDLAEGEILKMIEAVL